MGTRAGGTVAGMKSAATGFPLMEVLGGIFGLSGLMGILGGGDSPRDEVTAEILNMLKGNLDKLGTPAFSKGEVNSLVSNIKKGIDVSTDISKTKIGSSLAEGMGAAGVPSGQPQASMYVSELAPLDAASVQAKTQTDQWGGEFWANLDAQAKNRYIQAISAAFGGAGQMPDMTGLQKGSLSFLNAFDMFGKGAGNLASMWKNLNYKPLKA